MSEDEDLERNLGVLEATSIGLGTMIGGGIFILPSIAAEQAGPASAISFALGGVVSMLAVFSHAELATAMEGVDGGEYVFVRRGLGPMLGSVVGWGMWIGLIFASAFYVVGFGQYLTFFYGDLPVVLVAIGLAVVLTALNYYGSAETAELEDAIVLILLVLIVAFVALGLPSVEGEQLQPFNPGGWGAVLATTGTVYVAFIGFGIITTATAEIENPGRNVPLAMAAAVLVPTVLYVLVMIVSTGVLPPEELHGSSIPVADVAAQFAGGIGALAMVVGAVLATVSSANASILAAGRVSYAMGGDRLLTDWIEVIHDRFGTPYRAVVLTGAGIAALVAVGVGIDVLAEVASFMFLVTYTLVHVALIQFRRHRETYDYDPEFELPGYLYPAVPVVGILAKVGVMTQMDPVVIAGGVALALAGAAWYFLYVRHREWIPEVG